MDLTAEPPALVNTDDVLPTAILERLDAIDANVEKIMNMAEQAQGQINDLGAAMQAVADHVSSASTTLGQWIADHQDAPLDFTPALNALSSLQAADGTLQSTVPQVPAQPLPDPIPDPGPPPDPGTPIDTTTPPDPTDPSTPPDLPPPGDLGTATDPTTGSGDTGIVPPDAGGATDTPTVNPL